MPKHSIGTIDDFPEGEGRPVEVNGLRIAVFNTEGDLYAILDWCPHKKLPLHAAGQPKFVGEEYLEEYGGEGATRGDVDVDELKINCPWHHLEWDLQTGHNPPTDRHIPTFDVEVIDDEVFIDL